MHATFAEPLHSAWCFCSTNFLVCEMVAPGSLHVTVCSTFSQDTTAETMPQSLICLHTHKDRHNSKRVLAVAVLCPPFHVCHLICIEQFLQSLNLCTPFLNNCAEPGRSCQILSMLKVSMTMLLPKQQSRLSAARVRPSQHSNTVTVPVFHKFALPVGSPCSICCPAFSLAQPAGQRLAWQ